MSNLSITKGDTSTFNITVKDSDGVIFDLNGYTMTFTAKNNIDDIDAEADISSVGVIADPALGIGVISLSPEDTSIDSGEYRYDIQISDGTNNVHTVVKNSLLIITDEITINK